VKSEPKAFASLSSGLLARKGAARPAMRPQGFGQAGASLEDLGWNDMGFEPPKPAVVPIRDDEHDAFGEELPEQPRPHATGLTPVQSPVHSQQAEIADRLRTDELEEEIDETAELYEPVAEDAGETAPVAAPAPQPAVRRAPTARAAPGSKAKAAFTLRLDPERHLKLRLACAVSGRSAQLLVTDALDALLAQIPELDAMAERAKRKG
jgi:hypothetical protein